MPDTVMAKMGLAHLSPVEDRPTPLCPRCGGQAYERHTRYGIRAECCGLWSWNRMPLADAATHEVRRKLAPLLKELSIAMTSNRAFSEMRRRTGFQSADDLNIALMNEATARKALAAAEDMLMDIMAGGLKL